MGLPSIGQLPEENCDDYFDASKAAVRIKVGLVLGFGLVLRLVLGAIQVLRNAFFQGI